MRTAMLGILAAIVAACFIKPPRPGTEAPDEPPNIAFVTSTTRTYTEIQNVANADAWCNEAASAAGLAGTYKAWLSSSTESAQNRFLNVRGWIRTDGKPFADTIDDIVVKRRMFYPLRIDEYGNDIVGVDRDYFVATATNADGTYGGDCNGFSGGGSLVRGNADSGGAAWTAEGPVSCATIGALRVYCLGSDHLSRVDAPPVIGPRIFITESPVLSGMGTAAFDDRCINDAQLAMLEGADRFRAVVATSTGSALANVGSAGRTWIRLDGVEVTADFQTFHAPPIATAKVRYLDSAYAWTGADRADTTGSSTCSNWIDTASSVARSGDAARTTSEAFALLQLLSTCAATNRHLYCAEAQ